MEIDELVRHQKEASGIYYIQNEYIDRDFYTEKLNIIFSDYKIDNITDFNQSTCFTYIINIDTDLVIGSDEFVEYVMSNKNPIYFVEVLISTVSPLVSIHFMKYYRQENNIRTEICDLPFNSEQKDIFNSIEMFAQKDGLSVIDDESLKTIMINGDLKQSVYMNYFNQEGRETSV